MANRSWTDQLTDRPTEMAHRLLDGHDNHYMYCTLNDACLMHVYHTHTHTHIHTCGPTNIHARTHTEIDITLETVTMVT